jgi:beta-lactamase regulating signal transducer with metallopeptidase domain
VDELLVFFARNTAAALILAVFVYGVTRVWRNPPVVHVLWLLVLLKLVAPPLMRVDWRSLVPPAPTSTTGHPIVGLSQMPLADRDARQTRVGPETARPQNQGRPHSDRQPTKRIGVDRSTLRSIGENLAGRLTLFWQSARGSLFWFWLAGTALWATVTASRVVRFRRLLQETLPAPEPLQRLAKEMASRLGVTRLPDVRSVDAAGGPLLWCLARRPTIVLPTGLFRQLDEEQASMILAHELAHLWRRDHWIRGIELVISTLYWWNPLAWFVRRQIHQAEEQCCDAWVRWAFPHCAKRYAEVLLLAADSLDSRTTAPPAPASLFLRPHSLKARIEMILQSRFAPRISTRSKFVVILLALIALPAFAQSTKSQEQNRSDSPRPSNPSIAARATKPARVPETPPTSEFPYTVHFEQGASRLLKGDKIDIVEVRGTAPTMMPGNIYWIKGTYRLASHDRASLMAVVTAASAADGWGNTLKVQTALVNKGAGTFTLFLPMSCKGWPHVSFYPAEGGGDLGGTYFGTGDSVLRQWWGEAPAKVKNVQSEFPLPDSLAAADVDSQRLWDTVGLRLSKISRGSLQLVNTRYEGGLEVMDIRSESPARRSSLRKNDIIVGVAHFQTLKRTDILWILDHRQDLAEDPSKLAFHIVRGGGPISVDVTLAP